MDIAVQTEEIKQSVAVELFRRQAIQHRNWWTTGAASPVTALAAVEQTTASAVLVASAMIVAPMVRRAAIGITKYKKGNLKLKYQ